MRGNERLDWKGYQLHYDWYQSLDTEDTCPYRLTEQQVAVLLAILEPVGWKTRWFAEVGTTIDTDWITALRDGIIHILNTPPDECDPTPPIDECCEEYTPDAPWIQYRPNDPFQTPGYTPPGFLLPPWYTNPGVPLPGVIPSDAMVNFLAFPNIFAVPTAGFPRFRILFEGSGQLEIEFVQIIQGGTALIYSDGDLLTLEAIDLTSIGITEVLSIGFILGFLGIENDAAILNTTIYEQNFDTPGKHYVDVIFIPNISVSDELVVGMGGGIRKITMCGLTPIQEEDGEEMPVSFRMTDSCILEYSNNGTDWVAVDGWATYAFDCLSGEDGSNGAPGEPGEPGADGASPEMRVLGNVVQWRQDDNTPTWTDLYVIPGVDTGSGGSGSGLGYQNCRYATAWVRDMRANILFAASETQIAWDSVLHSPADAMASIKANWGYDEGEAVQDAIDTFVNYLWDNEEVSSGFIASFISELSFEDVLMNLSTKLKCSMSADLTVCPDDLTAWAGRVAAWYGDAFWWIGWTILANALTANEYDELVEHASANFWLECDVACDDSPTACDLEPPPLELTFSHNFLFQLGSGSWYGSTGDFDTRWIFAQGWRPGAYYSGTILNTACIGIRSSTFSRKLTKITVLLNTNLYPDYRCNIALVGSESGDFEYNAFIDLVEGLTVVEFDIPSDLEYMQIHILVEHLTACSDPAINGSPLLVGVVVDGLGSDPF